MIFRFCLGPLWAKTSNLINLASPTPQTYITFFGDYTSAAVPSSCVVSLSEAVREAKLHRPRVASSNAAARFRLSLQELLTYMKVCGELIHTCTLPRNPA